MCSPSTEDLLVEFELESRNGCNLVNFSGASISISIRMSSSSLLKPNITQKALRSIENGALEGPNRHSA